MRALKLLLAASGVIAYFIGIVVVSALTTSAVHSSFFQRTAPMAFARE